MLLTRESHERVGTAHHNAAFRSLSPPPSALGLYLFVLLPRNPRAPGTMPTPSQQPWRTSGSTWPGHSLFCPPAPATSSLYLSPLPAVPGSSSKAPVIWWQHVPGHSLTSSLFLVSPVDQRVEGNQPSCATYQEGCLVMPVGPNALGTGSPMKVGGGCLLVTQRYTAMTRSKQPRLQLGQCPVYRHCQYSFL